MEEAPENGKDSSQSSHANGMNESVQGSESLSGLINFRCHSTFRNSHGR